MPIVLTLLAEGAALTLVVVGSGYAVCLAALEALGLGDASEEQVVTKRG